MVSPPVIHKSASSRENALGWIAVGTVKSILIAKKPKLPMGSYESSFISCWWTYILNY